MQRNAPFEKAADKTRRITKSSNHGENAVAIPEIKQPIQATNIAFRRPMLNNIIK